MRQMILAAALLVVAGTAQATEVGQIVVTGTGTVSVSPDLARITLGVETEADSAAEALSGTAEQMQRIFAVLEEEGLEGREIQTSELALHPRWDQPGEGGGTPVISGYTASNLVTIQLRDIDALGGLIDALGTAGANRIHGISFELDDDKAALERAREAAVVDAMARADLYTRAAGVVRGAVLSISEGEAMTPPPMPMFGRAEMSADMPVAGGEITIQAQVRIAFELNRE